MALPGPPKVTYSRGTSLAVYASHRLTVVALVLVLLWAINADTQRGYLGGLGAWRVPLVRNWYFVLSVGAVACLTEAVLAHRAFPLDKSVNRRVRWFWETAALVMVAAGYFAAVEYRIGTGQLTMWSLQSWYQVRGGHCHAVCCSNNNYHYYAITSAPLLTPPAR